MFTRGLRRFHFGRKSTKISKNDSCISAELVQAAQALRLQLSNDGNLDNNNAPTSSLVNIAEAMQTSQKVPESLFRLVGKALQSQPNYKGIMSATDLEMLFQAIAKHNGDLNLATKLYMDLYRHSRLSPEQKLNNGMKYYHLLRSSGYTAEANKMVAALLRDNQSAVNDDFVLKLAEIAVLEHPNNTDVGSDLSSALLAIISAFSFETPSQRVISQFIRYLLDHKSLNGLEELSSFLYFTNPHFNLSDEAAIIFLDAFLQLPVKPNGSGEKLLKLSLAKVHEKTPLEVCELLLMACIHFQEPVALGSRVREIISTSYDADVDFTKETWDALAQWSVYSSSTPLESLKTEVFGQMPTEFIDNQALCAILTAGDKAQCSEKQISQLVKYLVDELEVTPDASVYEILIRRALKSVEVERARLLFIESNTDWNADSNKYIGVLSDLIVELCRTTSISRQAVMDVYQRVRLFLPQVSYKAQVALLEMFLQACSETDLTPAGVFLIEQFGETPDLPYEKYKEIFDLFLTRILAVNKEVEAWNLFGMLNCTIHLPYGAYYPLQRKMCNLGRPDAAHLLFRQLRARSKREGTRPPGEEIYAMLFTEYTKWCYEEGIMELETYFRVDLNQEMTPLMMNRMLAAYAALGDGHKVFNLWTEVIALPRGGPHGPNNETMCIMLQFFNINMGMDAVEDLWTKMPATFKVLPTQQSLKQYIIANCYHGFYMRALEIVKMAPKEYKIEINAEILQALYNWTMLPGRKQEVREFASKEYPEEWSLLESTNGSLKEILLPMENDVGETDETSLRLAAIKELQEEDKRHLVPK